MPDKENLKDLRKTLSEDVKQAREAVRWAVKQHPERALDLLRALLADEKVFRSEKKEEEE